MCHITSQLMGKYSLGPFLPVPGTYPGIQGSKNGYFWLNPDQMNRGGSRLGQSTWKGPDVPYHIPIDGKVYLGAREI